MTPRTGIAARAVIAVALWLAVPVPAQDRPALPNDLPSKWKGDEHITGVLDEFRLSAAERQTLRAQSAQLSALMHGAKAVSPLPRGFIAGFYSTVSQEFKSPPSDARTPLPFFGDVHFAYRIQDCLTCPIDDSTNGRANVRIWMNNPGAFLTVATTDADDNPTLWYRPRRTGTNQGFPVFDGRSPYTVLVTGAKPLWLPVSRGEFLDALVTVAKRGVAGTSGDEATTLKEMDRSIADARRSGDAALAAQLLKARADFIASMAQMRTTGADQSAVRTLETERASFSAAELRLPAWTAPNERVNGLKLNGMREYSRLVTDTVDAEQVVKLNPAYFDASSPRAAWQLAVMQSRQSGDMADSELNEPAVYRLRTAAERTMDLAALRRLMRP